MAASEMTFDRESEERVDEARLKAAVIDRLIAGGHADDDAVIVTEMIVANWSRRADVVLANGKIWGFELKSEFDRLSRLDGQIRTFTNYFEKFTVVVAERFADEALKLVPEGVGVWVASKSGVLTQRIPPKANVLSKEAYISLMTVTELRKLLICNGIKTAEISNRAKAEAAVRLLPVKDIANAAREAIKTRHRARYGRFLTRRAKNKTIGALFELQREKPEKVPVKPLQFSVEEIGQDVEIVPSNPLLVSAPCGPILKRLIS